MGAPDPRRVTSLSLNFYGDEPDAPTTWARLVVTFEGGRRIGVDQPIGEGRNSLSREEFDRLLAALAQFVARDRLVAPDVPKRGSIDAGDPEWLAKIRRGIG